MDESLARSLLVEYGERLWARRLVAGTSGNISLRLDDGDVIVTPAARSLSGLRPEDLVRVDRSGRTPRAASQRATSELPLHLAAYRKRPEIACVVHTHPTFCVVWSTSGSLFPRDTVGANESLGSVVWTPYHPSGSPELADICAAEFARGADAVLMERHGLTAIGRSLEAAFTQTDLAEEAARVAYFSRLAGWGTPCGENPPCGEGVPAT